MNACTEVEAYVRELAFAAKAASYDMALASSDIKNAALNAMAGALRSHADDILAANALDVQAAQAAGTKESLVDRLLLTQARLEDMASALEDLVALPDPVGAVLEERTMYNGMALSRVRVPLGVVAVVYEARPNVTVDAAVLTLKSGNAVILRGGKEAINSNLAVVKIMQDALEKAGLPRECISLVEDTSRDSANELMNLRDYVDLLIPRGGRGLIRSVCENASVPVIRTGEGVCHVYIDKEADLEMGAKVLFNAKCSRPSVCNAAECAIVHEDVVKEFLKLAKPLLDEKNVEYRCDERSVDCIGKQAVLATKEDWDSEYDDYILAVKTVSSVEEAIDFITEHGTGHSEAIITKNEKTAEKFLNSIDAAAVYWNASTRFTDGGEFGLGAEIGISTQKMHARGPMGLSEMTSYKYVITGNGQVR